MESGPIGDSSLPGLDMRARKGTKISGVFIRQARDADAAAICELIAELGYKRTSTQTRHTVARLNAKACEGGDLLLVAENTERVVCGWLQAHAAEVLESGFRVEILGLIVASSMRRRGVGQQLVAAAEQWARRLRARTLVVRSNVNRHESHSFYPALEFKAAKTQVVYKKTLRKGKWT